MQPLSTSRKAIDLLEALRVCRELREPSLIAYPQENKRFSQGETVWCLLDCIVKVALEQGLRASVQRLSDHQTTGDSSGMTQKMELLNSVHQFLGEFINDYYKKLEPQTVDIR